MYPLQLSLLLPLHYRHGFHSRLEDLYRPLRYCLGGIRPKQTTCQILFPNVFAVQVESTQCERVVFHCRLHESQNLRFKVSHLFYAATSCTQYQAVVKLLGSFRLAAGNRHLHRYCIFTERVLETVPQSLHHSCASELT